MRMRFGWNKMDEVMRPAYERLQAIRLILDREELSTTENRDARFKLHRISAHAMDAMKFFDAPVYYTLVWSPEGKPIATVRAKSALAAKRQIPVPYKKYKGEVYARFESLGILKQ